MALIGVGLVAACSSTKPLSPTESDIAQVITDKQILVFDATSLLASSQELKPALKAVISQNLNHIAVLENFLETAIPTPSSLPTTSIDLAAVTSRCAVFSTSHLIVACRSSDPELSRIMAQISASEMQHHALLTGLLS